MSFDNIDVINSWKYWSLIDSKNASMIIAAMEMLYASRLTKCLDY